MNYPKFKIKSITLDEWGWVTVTQADDGMRREQSVEATLMFLILHELREMNKRESEPEPL